MPQTEPLKTGFIVTEIDGSPFDAPVKLVFPNGSLTRTLSNELRVDCITTSSANSVFLRLDASNDPLTGELVITPASGTNALKANLDITIKAGQKMILDGA